MTTSSAIRAMPRRNYSDPLFRALIYTAGFGMIVLMVGIILLLIADSSESLQRYGISFLTNSNWDPVAGAGHEQFGAAPFIFGTVVTSILALILSLPLALGAALYISEYAPRALAGVLAFIIELLVAIPSVGFGLWGLLVLVPFMRSTVDPLLRHTLGHVPIIGALFSGGQPIGQDMLTAGVILAIMILPTILSVSREIIAQVPRNQKEGMLALGATKWETLRDAVLPYARGGIIGSAVLGLARAIGETMAVTMVIGNSSQVITPSLFNPGYTVASAIANQFTEADTSVYFSAVVELGLVLLLVASVFNIISRLLVWRLTRLSHVAE